CGHSLTERGKTNKVVLATGTGQDGNFSDAALACAMPGTAAAIYMGIKQADEIRAGLLSRGMPGDTVVTVAANVSKPSQRIVETPLNALPDTLQAQGITGNAVIMLRWNLSQRAQSCIAAE
ncbi:MAG: uroporphyrinogen-III C-methyltransferase, partial [Pseudomonadota bacterium]